MEWFHLLLSWPPSCSSAIVFQIAVVTHLKRQSCPALLELSGVHKYSFRSFYFTLSQSSEMLRNNNLEVFYQCFGCLGPSEMEIYLKWQWITARWAKYLEKGSKGNSVQSMCFKHDCQLFKMSSVQAECLKLCISSWFIHCNFYKCQEPFMIFVVQIHFVTANPSKQLIFYVLFDGALLSCQCTSF